jgi:hypothetical protein
MTNTTTAVIRDGIAVELTTEDPMRWVHLHHSYSLEHAERYEGYTFADGEAVVRGWTAFLRIAGSPAYGVDGYVVRSLRELVALAFGPDADTRVGDYILRDRVVAPALSALVAALDYLSGDLAIIAGELDAAARKVAAEFGLDAENI